MSKNKYSYAVEKLTNMLEVLATHPGDVRARLASAYWTFHQLKSNDLPPDQRKEWMRLCKELTKRGPLVSVTGTQVVGSLENTMKHMRRSTGQRIAKSLYELYWRLSDNKRYE